MLVPKLFRFALLCLLSTAVANTQAQKQDSPGTADHPLVSRYSGSYIDGQEVQDFNAYTLPVGPAVRDAAGQRVPFKKISLEGKVTRTLYRGPKGRSTLEILRNYQSGLESAGFKTLYRCGGRDCGKLFHWVFYKEMSQRIRSTKQAGAPLTFHRTYNTSQQKAWWAARSSMFQCWSLSTLVSVK